MDLYSYKLTNVHTSKILNQDLKWVNEKPYNLNAIQPTLSCNLLSVVDILNLSLTIVLQFHKKSYALILNNNSLQKQDAK